MKFIGIIPARYASTRFPGKPLAMLGGKPVIQHVYEKVAAQRLSRIWPSVSSGIHFDPGWKNNPAELYSSCIF